MASPAPRPGSERAPPPPPDGVLSGGLNEPRRPQEAGAPATRKCPLAGNASGPRSGPRPGVFWTSLRSLNGGRERPRSVALRPAWRAPSWSLSGCRPGPSETCPASASPTPDGASLRARGGAPPGAVRPAEHAGRWVPGNQSTGARAGEESWAPWPPASHPAAPSPRHHLDALGGLSPELDSANHDRVVAASRRDEAVAPFHDIS